MVELIHVVLPVISTIIASVGILLFKIASAGDVKKIYRNVPFIVGAILFVFATVLFIVALKLENLTSLFPITSLTYVWVMILSKTYLKEKITRWKILSIVFIVAGIVFTTL
jgi:drug/metabolite transporter (DMT)-like permease